MLHSTPHSTLCRRCRCRRMDVRYAVLQAAGGGGEAQRGRADMGARGPMPADGRGVGVQPGAPAAPAALLCLLRWSGAV